MSMDHITKAIVDHVPLTYDLLARVRQKPAWTLCRRLERDDVIHVSFVDRPRRPRNPAEADIAPALVNSVPLCKHKGVHTAVKFASLGVGLKLCGVCHLRLKQIGALE